MDKEEIGILFEKYKVRIPKEKQGQSECYECKRHNKYSLTWTSFLYEYEEKYYCFEHIVNILLQQENQSLKKRLEERPKEYVFIGNAQNKTRDFINEIIRANKELENQQKEFIDYLKCYIKEMEEEIGNSITKPYKENHIIRKNVYQEILSKYKEIIGGKDGTKNI